LAQLRVENVRVDHGPAHIVKDLTLRITGWELVNL
jgi:hypothetical protein